MLECVLQKGIIMWEWKESHHFYHYTGNQIVYTDLFFFSLSMICLEILQLPGMYVLKSGLT